MTFWAQTYEAGELGGALVAVPRVSAAQAAAHRAAAIRHVHMRSVIALCEMHRGYRRRAPHVSLRTTSAGLVCCVRWLT